MARLVMVCGPTGVGKTTYSLKLSKEIDAIRFSIDPWMQGLFSKDMVALDYNWMFERVNRCYDKIWEVSEQILALDGTVILDLGFTTKEQRDVFTNRAKALEINAEIHYLDASTEVRRQRVDQRNLQQDPAVYAFEVTDEMFNFMEPLFEVPDEQELKYGCKVGA